MLKEFKEFALKGNVIDLAIGVIIGGAFGKIVTSLVNDLIMPVFALFTSGVNFKDMAYVSGDVTISYGNFIQTVVDFLIIAFSIFIAVKLINKAKAKDAAENSVIQPQAPSQPNQAQTQPPAPAIQGAQAQPQAGQTQPQEDQAQTQLLTEIRDLLKSQQQ